MATMMKRLRLIYALLLALPLLVACTSDDSTNSNGTQQDGKITVHLRLSQAGSTAMRAESEIDPNADSKELMNVWTVVVTDNEGSVEKILACQPAEGFQEIDPIEYELKLTENATYHFYSFANISPEYVKYLLNITSEKPTSDDTFETGYTKGDILELEFPQSSVITKAVAEAKTIGINGNKFNIEGEANDFLSTGIPMSNVQTINVTSTTKEIDLVVVRLLAKIKLEITNTSSESVTIESVTLTDITKYETGKDNLKLFPAYIESASGDENIKDKYTHGHIQPNLNTGATTEDVTVTVGKTIAFEGKEDVIFYVNESATPTTNEFKHFFLKLNLLKGTTNTEVRYALIDDNNADKYEGKWDYIARNDYRIIPISLDDYKLELIPYDFPAIGVHPASVKEEDGLYTITFHDYGHFHLVPKVTEFTASGTEVVDYGTTDGTWGLINNRFEDSWKSWDSFGGTTYDNATGGFYREKNDTEDADEAGGVPVWYKNDGTDGPQWSPDGSENYPPFIFGYIADPEKTLTTDRKVYHEFSIYLYKNGTGTPRQMIYRLYMILDTDQMLYRQNGAAPVRHTHGH